MFYPFGFDTDYRGFYFRSIFLPIALLAAGRRGRYGRAQDDEQMYLVLIARFFSTLPTFYYFQVSPEFPAPSHWGLVDNFLGGISALAGAACVRRSASDRGSGRRSGNSFQLLRPDQANGRACNGVDRPDLVRAGRASIAIRAAFARRTTKHDPMAPARLDHFRRAGHRGSCGVVFVTVFVAAKPGIRQSRHRDHKPSCNSLGPGCKAWFTRAPPSPSLRGRS